MKCIKCRLSSSFLFSDSRFLFNESLTSTALSILQEYVRSWILCVPLCAELDAMVRKLTSLICFDIFQSKWYRNALIANTTFGTPIKAFRYHFDWKVSKLIFLICCDIFQSKWYRNALIANTLFGKPINACNAKQFNIELERLMFCKTIRRNATPFDGTLYHLTLRWAISRNATPFVRTLCYSTLPWAISSNATPFGLCTVLFDIALSHLTQRYTVCVLYCKWVLSYSQSS